MNLKRDFCFFRFKDLNKFFIDKIQTLTNFYFISFHFWKILVWFDVKSNPQTSHSTGVNRDLFVAWTRKGLDRYAQPDKIKSKIFQ